MQDMDWPPKDSDVTSPIDALFTSTCQVLRDDRIVKLKERIQDLELQLFFKDHSGSTLTTAVNAANFNLVEDKNIPYCCCRSCYLAERIDEDGVTDLENPFDMVNGYDLEQTSCNLTPWFVNLAGECGLKVALISKAPYKNNALCGHVVDTDAHLVCDLDEKHIEQGWRYILFGSRLFKAKSIHDPELKKLWFLFRLLETFRVDVEREDLLRRAKEHADKIDGLSAALQAMEVSESKPSQTINLKKYIHAMDLSCDFWYSVPFLRVLQAQNVELHVHLMAQNDDADDAMQGKVHRMIKPCVQNFYQRSDFGVGMLNNAYFVVTLSRTNETAKDVAADDVLGCVVAWWHPYPENTFEVRFESLRRELVGPDMSAGLDLESRVGSDVDMQPDMQLARVFQCYKDLLLQGLHWGVHFIARNDPFIMLNLGSSRIVSVHMNLDLDESYEKCVGPSVWGQKALEAEGYRHVQDMQQERLMEIELVFK